MTISKKQLQEALLAGIQQGKQQQREIENRELADLRRINILKIADAAAIVAKANASLTYSLSRLMDQMK